MNKTFSISCWMAGVTFAGLGLFACSRAAEVCGAQCDCELCSDRKYDMCKIEVSASIDEANAYDCGDDYQAYLDCRLDRSECADHHNWQLAQDACQSELTRYHDCVEAASSLDDNVTPPPIDCICICTCGSLANQATACATGAGCCTGACQALCATGDAGAFTPPADETCAAI
jgi:hypothetical protein